jgi:2-phosphosulfolactate phosphatase
MNFVQPEVLAGGVVIVIDAIRASTTMCTALANGARAIVPVLTAKDARATKARLGDEVLLGGERGGVRIEGFDLDNSPRSYTSDRIRGRTIIFTTSNGTAGLLHAKRAQRVLVGSLVNVDAVARAVAHDERPVHILCCGTRNEVSLDDCLPAGAMVEKLVRAGRNTTADDSASLVLHAWRDASRDVRAAFAESRGGRNMVRIGLGQDVDICASLDSVPIAPEFHVQAGAISAS